MHIPGELIPIVALLVIPISVIGVPLARAFARRIERGPAVAPAASSEVQARLERMEQALDSIAIEVERISEGQRFTSKLLAERNNAPGSNVTTRQQ